MAETKSTEEMSLDELKTYFAEKKAKLEEEYGHSIIIPDTVKVIDENAFAMCKGLKEVIINDGVKTIKKYAFRDCAKLERIVIPSSVKKLDNSVFCGCKNLKNIEWKHE